MAKCWRFKNSHCGRWAVSTTSSDTFSSQVSFDEVSLRAWIPQTRIQRLQPRQSHQQHRRPCPPLPPPCQPLSRTHQLQLVLLDLPLDSSRLSLQQAFLQGHQKGKGKQELERLIQCPLGTNWWLWAGWHFVPTFFENELEGRG